MKFSNFYRQFVDKFDIPKYSKLAKISSFLNTSWTVANEGSKFKLHCVESKNSYISLIDVINFKLRLVNFVSIFVRHPVI